MIVSVKLVGSLRERAPPDPLQELTDRASVRDLLGKLNIPPQRVQVVSVNNRFEYDHSRQLCDGDAVTVLPNTFNHACDVNASN